MGHHLVQDIARGALGLGAEVRQLLQLAGLEEGVGLVDKVLHAVKGFSVYRPALPYKGYGINGEARQEEQDGAAGSYKLLYSYIHRLLKLYQFGKSK